MLDFLTAWINYLITTRWSYDETQPEQAEREWKSFDTTYAEANRIFTGPGSADSVGFLGKTMKKMAENLMHLAFRVGAAVPANRTHWRSLISRDRRRTCRGTSGSLHHPSQ